MANIQINLLPWREQARKMKKTQLLIMIGFFSFLAVVIVFVLHLYFASFVSVQQSRNNYLQGELSQQQQILASLQQQKKDLDEKSEQLNFLMKLRVVSFQAVMILNEIEKIIPTTVFMTRIEFEKNLVKLEGFSRSDLDITLFMEKIAKDSLFSKPVLTEISNKKEMTEPVKFFRLEVQLKVTET